MAEKITVQGNSVSVISINKQDFISITDIAKHRNPDTPADIVKNWMRSKSTIEFLGLWEKLNNPDFKLVDFDQFRNEAGANYFVLSPQKWVESTNAIGLISKSGRYGGTYAHPDIAFEFASWISVEFKLYLIKEFERLKDHERKQLGWDIRRNLAKINYRIHTDAIKQNLIPPQITTQKANFIYANEADVLNMALFGITAKEWREQNPDLSGNIRDYATAAQLVCLSNLETLNALFIQQKIDQPKRLLKLNQIAIQQMNILAADPQVNQLTSGEE
jgi:hypothetical protein